MEKNNGELESLKRRVSCLAVNAGGHREYSLEIKEEILRFVERHVSSGGSRIELARELGVHSSTIAYWGKPSKCGKRLRAVAVVDVVQQGEPSHPTTLFSCGVARLEGLTLPQVAELLKALSC